LTVWLRVFRMDSWRAASRLLVRERWLTSLAFAMRAGHVLVVVGLGAEGVQGVAEVGAVRVVGAEGGEVALGELVGMRGFGAVVDGGGGGSNVCGVGDLGW